MQILTQSAFLDAPALGAGCLPATTMKEQLVCLLPCTFEHLAPPFRDTYRHFGSGLTVLYDPSALLACAVICKDWTWPAQAELFRRPDIVRDEKGSPDIHLGGTGA